MTAFLIVVAVLCGAIGFIYLSQATTGVGVICLGVLCAVLARINQAENHKKMQQPTTQYDEINGQ